MAKGKYITMKSWRINKAEELGIAPTSVAGRIHKGKLKVPKTIRKNKRVVLVYSE